MVTERPRVIIFDREICNYDAVNCKILRSPQQTFKTFYNGNPVYSADDSETQDRLIKIFRQTTLEKAVVPTKDGRSRGYGLIQAFWQKDAPVPVNDICMDVTGFKIHGYPIYL